MKVSVVIATYKREESLKNLLKDLFAQNENDFEIIIVDQSPSPSNVLSEIAAGSNGKVSYIAGISQNAALARNRGVKEAKGEIVVLCDDDILVKPDFITNHLKNYSERDVGGVSGRVVCYGDGPVGDIKAVGRIRKYDGKITANFNADFKTEVEHAYGCNLSFRRELLIKTGGYDERLIGTGSFDDADVSFKIRKLGYKIVFEPMADAVHLLSVGGYRDLSFEEKMYWYYHNFMIFYLKHMHKVFLPLFLIRQVCGSFRRAFTKKNPAVINFSLSGLASGVSDYLKLNEKGRMKASIKSKENIKRILATRLQGMGDVVCFMPALRSLRDNFPGAEITVLVGRLSGREVIENCPWIDAVIFYDIEKKRNYFEKIRFVKLLRQKKFDLIIMSSQEVGFALKAFLSAARYRAGFGRYTVNGITSTDRFGFLNSLSLESRKPEHDIEANLRLLETLGLDIKNRNLELPVKEKDAAVAAGIFNEAGFGSKKVVAINPSSNRSVKNWPKEKYAQLIKELKEKHGAEVVLIGAQKDMQLNREISGMSGSKILDLAGKTTLGELIAVLNKCHLFIGNDSGPMNIAAALNMPVVALFGPGDEVKFRPYCANYIVVSKRVDCAPCNEHSCALDKCMQPIEVEEVLRAAEFFLSRQ
ncbi:MAG: glycosyltransferase family 9 protein [Candidatus Omnitrophica bacterium]|nr:glycosyltransferase family 9 protein [Candidatus Omnitrophota bacterium]